MGAAHLPAYGAIEMVAQHVGIVGVRSQSQSRDIGQRPVVVLRYRSVRFDAKDVRGRYPEHISIHRRCMIRVIEHQKIGKFLLA